MTSNGSSTNKARGLCSPGLFWWLLSLPLLAGCPVPPPPDPPGLDCAEIDRAEERFPEECSDAGLEAAESAQ
jgi:hypothetical protein